MISPRNRVFFWVAPLVVASGFLIAIVNSRPGVGVVDSIAVGYFFGASFGHVALAAAWAAFGPGSLARRLPLSSIWVALLAVASTVNFALHPWQPQTMAVVMAFCLLGQWVGLQCPLWVFALRSGWRLRHLEEGQQGDSPHRLQFGIRQLIILTSIVGVILGVGRMTFAGNGMEFSLRIGETAIFVFLAVVGALLTLPMMLVLIRGLMIPGVVLALVLAGVMSFLEQPLMQAFHVGPRPDTPHFIVINTFTAIVTLGIAVIVRLNGYSLTRTQAPAKA